MIITSIVIVISGCTTTKFLGTYPVSCSPTTYVEVYWEKPNKPFIELGMIIVESEIFGEEKLLVKLKEKAMAVGANAVIMRSPSKESILYPYYTPVPRGIGMITVGTTTINRLEGVAIRFKDTYTSNQVAKPSTDKPITSVPVASSKPNIVTVIWTFANIRSGASNEFPVVTSVKRGEKLAVIGEMGEWFNVRLENGKEGWINSRVVK
jgi:hypothetical protein